jgi:hypothetical protein
MSESTSKRARKHGDLREIRIRVRVTAPRISRLEKHCEKFGSHQNLPKMAPESAQNQRQKDSAISKSIEQQSSNRTHEAYAT